MPRPRNLLPPLRVLLALLLLLAGAAWAQEKPLTILHFNDLHAALIPDSGQRGGLAYLAATIRREEANCNSCILLSAGDLVQGTPVSTMFHGVPLYELANGLGIDASTLGNHEFDYGWKETLVFMRKAHFPTVCADIVDSSGKLFVRTPYVILVRNGMRIGVLGVMTDDLPVLTTPETRGPWRTLPLLATVHKYAAELRDKTDVIVLLAHLTPSEEDMVLRDAPEIPVVVSGHTHQSLDSAKTVDGRVLVRVGPSGRELGRLDLKVDVAHKTVSSVTWKRIPVDANSIAPAPDVAKQVAHWEQKVAKVVNVPIGQAKRTIAGTELKQLIERATAGEMGTDFSFMNEGGIRAPLPSGQLLVRHVWSILPFDNRVVVGRFKGKDLPEAVKAGKQIDPEREYTLAVNDFTAANQESEMGTKGLQFPKVGPLHRDVLMEWIKKQKVIE